MSPYQVSETQKLSLLEWVADAKRGRPYLYHTGFLCRDVDRLKEGKSKLIATRSIAWSLYEKGYVLLVQQKIGPMSYEYIAVRTGKLYK
jgi:hypothetical protein